MVGGVYYRTIQGSEKHFAMEWKKSQMVLNTTERNKKCNKENETWKSNWYRPSISGNDGSIAAIDDLDAEMVTNLQGKSISGELCMI